MDRFHFMCQQVGGLAQKWAANLWQAEEEGMWLKAVKQVTKRDLVQANLNLLEIEPVDGEKSDTLKKALHYGESAEKITAGIFRDLRSDPRFSSNFRVLHTRSKKRLCTRRGYTFFLPQSLANGMEIMPNNASYRNLCIWRHLLQTL